MKKHLVTRTFHVMLAIAVIHQVVVSIFMQAPLEGKSANFAFELHKLVGLITLAIVILFWGWVLIRSVDTSVKALFPWFSPDNRRQLFTDIHEVGLQLMRGRLPQLSIESALASAVHGLGLLLVLGLALTGSGWLLCVGHYKLIAALLIDIHDTLAFLVWCYLVAHGAMALLHEFYGQAVLRRMFPFGKKLETDKSHQDVEA